MAVHIPRQAQTLLETLLARNPAVLIVGARQIGKSSLARRIAAGRPSVIFDLEKYQDLDKLDDYGVQLRKHADKLVVIDEVQNKPELFSELRVIIDELRAADRPYGKFLLLGSVSGRLQRQSEGLTGRIARIRMHSLNWLEVAGQFQLQHRWQRGGLPTSLLAEDDAHSLDWRQEYIDTTIHKDVLTRAGSQITVDDYRKLLTLIAARQKDILNKGKLAGEMGHRAETINTMLANLADLMLIRKLPAYAQEIPRRLVKSPKYYICDSGIFFALVNKKLADSDNRAGTMLRGAAWEGFFIENLLSAMPRHWHPFFFRAHGSGHEVDLLFEQPGGQLWAVEIKSGEDATPNRKFLGALRHLQPQRSFLVHGGDFKHRGRNDIEILPLADMMNELRAQETLAAAAAHPAGFLAGCQLRDADQIAWRKFTAAAPASPQVRRIFRRSSRSPAGKKSGTG